MFPIDFLRLSANSEVTIYLKNGETLSGILLTMDNYMNLRLKTASLTSKDGKITKMDDVYIRGIEVKNIQLPDNVLEEAAALEKSRPVPMFSQPQPRKENFGRSCENRQGTPKNFRNNRMAVKPVEADDWVF